MQIITGCASTSYCLLILLQSICLSAVQAGDDRWKIVGCFAASTRSEAPMQLRIYWPNDTEFIMSQDACFRNCAFQLWEGRFFGLSKNGGCLCGTIVQAGSATLPDITCGARCLHNPIDTCGGVDAMQVFVATKVPRLPARVFGCFLQTDEQKVFDGEVQLQDSSFMSHARCATYCLRIRNSILFGLTSWSRCYCSETYPRNLVTVSYSLCYHPCANYNFEPCGGWHAMLVLELHHIEV